MSTKSRSVYVDIDVDLDDFSDAEIREECINRGIEITPAKAASTSDNDVTDRDRAEIALIGGDVPLFLYYIGREISYDLESIVVNYYRQRVAA